MLLLWRIPRRFSATETLIALAQNVQRACPASLDTREANHSYRLNYFRLIESSRDGRRDINFIAPLTLEKEHGRSTNLLSLICRAYLSLRLFRRPRVFFIFATQLQVSQIFTRKTIFANATSHMSVDYNR